MLLLPALPVRAAEKLWGALIFASNVEKPAEPPSELTPYLGKLSKIFGYNQFSIVAEESEKIGRADREWELNSKFITVKVEPLSVDAGTYELALTMLREEQVLLEMKSRVGIGSPLLIRGPMCGGGQLIILLEVR